MLQSAPDGPPARSIVFAGRPIEYDDTVLTPRPWTEIQSAWARDLIEESAPGSVLELCSGAGHIGLAAVRGTGRTLVQVDASLGACTWACRNAAAWGVDADIRHAPMAEALAPGERFDVIVADPPWVISDEVGRFPEDPVTAIDGGSDGLDLARECLRVVARHLTGDGRALLQLGRPEQARRLEPEARELGLDLAEVRQFEDRGIVVLVVRSRGQEREETR